MLRFWKCLLPKDAPKPQTNCPALESTEGVDVLMRSSHSYLNKQCCCQAQTRNTSSWHLQQGCITQMVRKAKPASNLKRRKKSKTLMRHKWVLPRFSSSVNCWRHLACLLATGWHHNTGFSQLPTTTDFSPNCGRTSNPTTNEKRKNC